MNFITFLLFYFDKKAAQKDGSRRAKELHLLMLSLLGGTFGAMIAMKLFRHKTRKISFLLKFWLIFGIQLIFFVAYQIFPI